MDDDEVPSTFSDINPYEVLGVAETASEEEIKKAYKKNALRLHPDKVPAAERDEAHTSFQKLAFAYAVVGDPKRRKRYDTTGETSESLLDDDFDWADYFRDQFAEIVTVEKIEEIRREYQGSAEERADVLAAYARFKGDLDRLFETIMLSSELEDEERFRGYIDEAIAAGEVEPFKAFTEESEAKRKARKKRAEKERAKAEKEAKKEAEKKAAGEGEGSGRSSKKKASKKGGKGAPDSLADLSAMIKGRQAQRQEAFFDNLEAKYGGGGKQKKRKIDEPSEEAFEAMKKRGQSKGKKT